MKRVVTILATVVATTLAYSGPAVSEYGSTGLTGEYGLSGQSENFGQKAMKDQCLLVAMNCSGVLDSVQLRVEKLKKEIEKGAVVYTPQELDAFKNQLMWIYSEGNNVL